MGAITDSLNIHMIKPYKPEDTPLRSQVTTNLHIINIHIHTKLHYILPCIVNYMYTHIIYYIVFMTRSFLFLNLFFLNICFFLFNS